MQIKEERIEFQGPHGIGGNTGMGDVTKSK